MRLFALPSVQAADLHPFSASYTADWKQLPMSGSAERSLTKKDNGVWTLSFKASMMIASLTETSVIRFDKDTLQPVELQLRTWRPGQGQENQPGLRPDRQEGHRL